MPVGRESPERVESDSDASADTGADTGADSDDAAARTAPSDAFAALGNETRMDALRALASDEPRAFSDLVDATDADTSAGFAYHLRQIDGRFVRQRADERYELTDAGRAVARGVEAGTFTGSVDREPVALDEDCPFCGDPELVATVTDNVTEVACEACDSPVLGLSFPPSGYADRDATALPAAFDAHHRRRIGAFADGLCPDCAGPVAASVEPAVERDRNDPNGVDRDDLDGANGDGHDHLPVRIAFECETCGAGLRCPVALSVLDHPAVVAFYHDHDRDVDDRPLWNVGTEWRERVVSRDPWCVLVSARLGDEDLLLYVAGDGTVVDHRRADVEDEPAAENSADTGSGDAESASA